MNGYKYRAINGYTLDSLKNNRVYFARFSDFNDPFEFSTPFPNLKIMYARVSEGVDKLYKQGKMSIKNYVQIKELCLNIINDASQDLDKVHGGIDKVMKEFGIYCLSEVSDEILMWSHYADNHKGICIGFRSLHDSFCPRPSVFGLNYTDCYSDLNDPKLVLEFYEEMYHRSVSLPFDEWQKKYESLMVDVKKIDDEKMAFAIITDKSSQWAYEREFRFVSRTSGLKEFAPEFITSITFGLRASDQDKKMIIEICKSSGKQHVEFFQAKKVEGVFALEIVSLE